MIYFAWLSNHTDCQDDDVLKIWAKDKREARKEAEDFCRCNFSISSIFTLKEFKKYDPDFHSLFWGQCPCNVSENEWRKMRKRSKK